MMKSLVNRAKVITNQQQQPLAGFLEMWFGEIVQPHENVFFFKSLLS